ncbi:S-adenosyl-L-methionine-dependent methyltransferase [Daldinia vernicosa]|uniref:S-adenosyl-L-methionine-dependent methyltransferase n=1 Tax=Daldinia vernicosa TaxID=114800 RepID=UPI0020087DEB|nr:S-adenosyl-L-methionine-dependent methyltransferase [Daldinia vernicosa]KAI0849149.1 S-adenosyl-L-methionine-dependent methyltransferase [Daldinia vernicosa]
MDTPPTPLTQLVSHFINRSRDNQPSEWTELWNHDKSYFWDRTGPSPALIDWIESQSEISQPHPNYRPIALIPDCGKGYDVIMLALHGFDAYGLEISQRAIQMAEVNAAAQFCEPSSYNFGSSKASRSIKYRGNVKFIQGDFFETGWEKQIATENFQGFDLIYDYAFLCALPPDLRKDWARRMRELISPVGVLACLEFPLYKDLRALGPPWGLKDVYWNILAEGGDGIMSENSIQDTRMLEGSFQRVAYFKPPRSYENGKGTDMFSVWKPKI